MHLDWFTQGGPVMYPLLLCSLLSVAVTLERAAFWLRWRRRRDDAAIGGVCRAVEAGRPDAAGARARAGGENAPAGDPIARICVDALAEAGDVLGHVTSAGSALVRSTRRFLRVHDTIVTLAPMLGILGTVVGIIESFQVIGAGPVAAPEDVTGGVAEALLTTAFGLVIAMLSLVPYNYFMGRSEEVAVEIEDALTRFEQAWLRGDDTEPSVPRLAIAQGKGGP